MRIYGVIQGYTESSILVCAVVDIEKVKGRIDLGGKRCVIELIDNRRILEQQRKKIYAMFKDISDYMGEYYIGGKESVKHMLKGGFIDANEDKDYGWFSLSNCSISLAREFINYLIEFCFENDIPTWESMIDRYDDINRYMYLCLKYKKCAVCNAPGEMHHVDVIGMGHNRRKKDDSDHRKIELCRVHHQEAETIGWTEFSKRYHVKGILY